MSGPVTHIRLITLDDAEAITAHICRDAEATARWDPPRSPDYYTLEGQRRRIERMLLRHATGESWPGVVLDGDAVIGQIVVQEILDRHPAPGAGSRHPGCQPGDQLHDLRSRPASR